MKKTQQVMLTLITTAAIFITSCGPNDDKGGMDQENSNKEGAVDSTRIPGFDSSHADSSHASILTPNTSVQSLKTL